MTDIKTVLTDEAIAAIASSLGYDQTLTSGRRFKFARAIEAAVLAASAPAQEPVAVASRGKVAFCVKWKTAGDYLIGQKDINLYAAPVDAQDAVDICEIRLCEVPRLMLRPNIHYIFTVDENCDACKSAEFHATPIDWQASQSPQDPVKEK